MANPMNVFGLVLCALLLLAICSFGFSSRNEFTHQNLRVQETYCPTVSIPRFTHVDFPIHISSKPPKKGECFCFFFFNFWIFLILILIDRI